jgi:hypothetical protein
MEGHMQNKLIKIFYMLIFAFELMMAQAQEAMPVSGGEAAGSGGSASYTIGQVIYTTNAGASGSVVQGVQQPYEIYIVSGLKEDREIGLSCIAYPNPSTNVLNLKVNSEMIHDLSYQLYDAKGTLLKKIKITGDETSISIEEIAPATYFLIVTENNNEIATFKIIKN